MLTGIDAAPSAGRLGPAQGASVTVYTALIPAVAVWLAGVAESVKFVNRPWP
jgi:hypothetical protein